MNTQPDIAGRSFIKMHGLGNDFAVFDGRADGFSPTPALARAIADRKTGIGCDQVITLEVSKRADIFMRIHNADGGEVDACGNAARCVAGLILSEAGDRGSLSIETNAGILDAHGAGDHISVDIGIPRFGWRDIPLSREMDTLNLDLSAGELSDPVGVSVGNPHVVFFTEDAEAVALAELGPDLETDALFPDRANINVAQIIDPAKLRLRVWERGAGITRACGTGACATLAAAVRRGLAGRRAEVVLDGGSLDIEWRDDDHIIMSGPWHISYHGIIDGLEASS